MPGKSDMCRYNSLNSSGSSGEDRVKGNMVKAYLLDEKNQPTRKVLHLRTEDIISWPCQGNCGYSRAECYLQYQNCQDWYCPSALEIKDLDCPTGGFRYRKDLKPPPCSNCGEDLVLPGTDKGDQGDLESCIIPDYSQQRNK